jgi:hypothetical protein
MIGAGEESNDLDHVAPLSAVSAKRVSSSNLHVTYLLKEAAEFWRGRETHCSICVQEGQPLLKRKVGAWDDDFLGP